MPILRKALSAAAAGIPFLQYMAKEFGGYYHSADGTMELEKVLSQGKVRIVQNVGLYL